MVFLETLHETIAKLNGTLVVLGTRIEELWPGIFEVFKQSVLYLAEGEQCV